MHLPIGLYDGLTLCERGREFESRSGQLDIGQQRCRFLLENIDKKMFSVENSPFWVLQYVIARKDLSHYILL